MSNSLLNGLKQATNYDYTENGAIKHNSTLSAVYDLFAVGAAYRSRDNGECLFLFNQAFRENPDLAMKCLFYIRDVRGGQGERRFFRVIINHLAKRHKDVLIKNIDKIPEYGRWDDLYSLVGTPVEAEALMLMQNQLAIDCEALASGKNTPVSLLGKWLKSCNASSITTKELGNTTRKFFSLSQREYRKLLSSLRSRINIVEKLMSENRWEEIQFDKIPSKAGLIYKDVFARRPETAERYRQFISSKETKVNAGTLYPYEVVRKAYSGSIVDDPTVREAVNKYWDNLTDYFNGSELNALCVCDTSGSMIWGYDSSTSPIDVATSIAMYCAERMGGPFKDHYISFSRNPKLIKVEGIDFVDKVRRIRGANLCENTDIEKVFSLILDTCCIYGLRQEELPEYIIVISDMEFDSGSMQSTRYMGTLMENIRVKWNRFGYKMPKLIYWNVSARNNNIPDLSADVSYVSGFSPSIFQQIMSGKTGIDLMLEVLNSERYKPIVA